MLVLVDRAKKQRLVPNTTTAFLFQMFLASDSQKLISLITVENVVGGSRAIVCSDNSSAVQTE